MQNISCNAELKPCVIEAPKQYNVYPEVTIANAFLMYHTKIIT